ncbi:MAG: hypothetical protein K2I92_05490, partial [Muribaculaceae bacterium]|nr:hypothetical protein [Muribaculaceae bacterium]
MNCNKCGNPLTPGTKFCLKCGHPVDQTVNNKSVGEIPNPTKPSMPRPGMPKPEMPRSGMPRTQAPAQVAPRPGMPRPGMPNPTIPQTDKGVFTNTVRSVANAMTGGALNREIAREQNLALRQQAQESQSEIRDARQAQQAAEQARERAERDAARAADRRSMELVDGIEVVRGRAIWNIQPGEIARRIKESELEEVEKLKGIIVQEGCTAVIYANGEQVATLSAGAYLFYKSVQEEQAALNAAVEATEKQMNEAERKRLAERRRAQPTFRELGIVGEMGRAARWVGRIIFGQKKKDEKARKRQIDYARLLSRLTQPPVMSVYIVSDRHIPLTFGGTTDGEGNIGFSPYSIPAGIHNVEIGVSLEVCVCDIHSLAVNYLSDHTRLTTSEVHNILSPAIENLLRTHLRNAAYDSTGLPADLTDRMKEWIARLVDQRLHGIRCTAVHSITDSNVDFERFRNIERQLYNTEREIDFMQRTGEFRNRMETEANSQQLQSARNAEELRHNLQKLNNDRLLHDDEIEEFVELLESQRRIRQATTAEEEQTALDELKKSRLVKQDEIEALQDALLHKKIPRVEITQLMRIQ